MREQVREKREAATRSFEKPFNRIFRRDQLSLFQDLLQVL